jgi:hypothetical protein
LIQELWNICLEIEESETCISKAEEELKGEKTSAEHSIWELERHGETEGTGWVHFIPFLSPLMANFATEKCSKGCSDINKYLLQLVRHAEQGSICTLAAPNSPCEMGSAGLASEVT